MIAFIRNVQKGQNYGDKKHTAIAQGGWEKMGVADMGTGFLCEGQNVLRLDCGDGHTTLWL